MIQSCEENNVSRQLKQLKYKKSILLFGKGCDAGVPFVDCLVPFLTNTVRNKSLGLVLSISNNPSYIQEKSTQNVLLSFKLRKVKSNCNIKSNKYR